MNPHIFQGHIDDNMARTIAKGVATEIAFMLAFSSDKYNVTEDRRDMLVTMVADSTYIGLTRAVNDGQRAHDDMSFRSAQQNQVTGISTGGMPKK